MTQKIDRSDTDFNTIYWNDDQITIARQSRSHVRISRFRHRLSRPAWSISLDVTGGHDLLHVAYGNRIACVNNRFLLAITCGEYGRGGSLHNYQLHHIHEDGRVLWSAPWQTIQRFTVVQDHLLVVRYVSPPMFYLEDAPLEACLIEPETGDLIANEFINIPDDLKPHYQSWQVQELKTYLVWKDGKLIVTVRPYFLSSYEPAKGLPGRGSFKHYLSLDGRIL